MTAAPQRSARLRQILDRPTGDVSSLRRLCADSARHLALTGAGVSVITAAGHRASVLATDDVSARIEELQVGLGEGPCIDAWRGGLPVLAPDLGRRALERWPGFSPAAAAAGAVAVFSVPLQVGQTRLGALDIYRDARGGLADQQLAEALHVGDVVTRALLRLELVRQSEGWSSTDQGLIFSAEIQQAVGMSTVQLDVDTDEALARMRAYAYSADLSLGEVAAMIVARKLRLERDR